MRKGQQRCGLSPVITAATCFLIWRPACARRDTCNYHANYWKEMAWELFSGKYKQTQHKSEKVKNLKYSKTELTWFSCLLQHLARKRGRLILQRPRAHTYAFSLFYEHLIGDNVTYFVCRLIRVPFCHLVIYRNVTFSKNLQNFNFQTQHLGIDYLDRNCGEKLRELSDIF